MIYYTKIEIRLANSDLQIHPGDSSSNPDHYRKLISTISALKRRSEKFSVVVQITDADSSIVADDGPLTNKMSLLAESLSKREMQVYRLAIGGLSNKEIAERLFVSVETVKSHRKSIVRKAKVKKIDDIKNLILQANRLIE